MRRQDFSTIRRSAFEAVYIIQQTKPVIREGVWITILLVFFHHHLGFYLLGCF